MAAENAGVDRALGAIGTTFRLMRLYPPTHPAVVEALKQIGEAIPGVAALGTVEWKVGVTGLHWHGQHLLPRNAQIAELAGLLYARGVRAVTLNPGMAPEHVLALFQVATGTVPPDDGTLGRITLTLGRRTSARLERLRTPTPASGAPAIPEPSAESSPPTAVTTEQSTAAAAGALMAGKRASAAFRPDVLPVDVEEAGRDRARQRRHDRGAGRRGRQARCARPPAVGVARRRHRGGCDRGARPPAADGKRSEGRTGDRPGGGRALRAWPGRALGAPARGGARAPRGARGGRDGRGRAGVAVHGARLGRVHRGARGPAGPVPGSGAQGGGPGPRPIAGQTGGPGCPGGGGGGRVRGSDGEPAGGGAVDSVVAACIGIRAGSGAARARRGGRARDRAAGDAGAQG